MTVCVAVKVHDCIVFAADSASSLIDTDPATGLVQVTNVYAHGNKVFNLYKGLPIAAMTCGMGNIGPVLISTLAKDFRAEISVRHQDGGIDNKNYSIEEVAKRARTFFFETHYKTICEQLIGDHEFQFWIGGNDSGRTHGEIWKITIRNGMCDVPELVAGQNEFRVSYAGQPEAINRLVSGYSQHLPQALLAAGLEPDKLDGLLKHIESFTFAPLASPAMPIQDAIALADFLVDTTKRFVRFLPGADSVGGETDICVVTKHEGFKWVKRKHYYNLDLNPRETRNVY